MVTALKYRVKHAKNHGYYAKSIDIKQCNGGLGLNHCSAPVLQQIQKKKKRVEKNIVRISATFAAVKIFVTF